MTAHLVEVLSRWDDVGGEAPAIFALDNKVQGALQLAIQPPHVTLPVRLGLAPSRQLDGSNVLAGDELGILADAHLCILQEALDDALLAAEGVTNLELILPSRGALAMVHTQLLGDGALALGNLEIPFHAAGRVGLEVDARDEGTVEALLQTLLVEEEGRLEGVEASREEGRPGEDESRPNVVRGGGVGGKRRR